MRRLSSILSALLFLAASIPALATVFANVHGVVHDPQHRPIPGANVTLKAAESAFTLDAKTDSEGEFDLLQAPIGVYELTISATGFATTEQSLAIASGTNPIVHILLSVAPATQTVVVQGLETSLSSSDSVTPTTLVTRADIDETPGANRTIGMEMITDYVPGAYMTHDMLHMRGGHQTSWLIDGIAIPNTKIASNVGPQIDPKDIDSLETQRGSYSSDVGDRTYGVFNVLPRNGFERDRDGEVLLSAGNLYTGEAQVSLGDHSAATAWYTSFTGGRSNYGLAPPVAQTVHDATNSESGFVSLIRNQTPKDQLRLNAQFRQDYFEVPYDPNPNDWEQDASGRQPLLRLLRPARRPDRARQLRHRQLGAHALAQGAVLGRALLSLQPGRLRLAPNRQPRRHHLASELELCGRPGRRARRRRPQQLFRWPLLVLSGRERSLRRHRQHDIPEHRLRPDPGTANAGLVEFYLSDHLRLGRYVTLLGGERFSIYHAGFNESATYPRIGATVEIPRLHWVLRGFYGHFFQPAPLDTVSSSVLNYASQQPTGENTFTPIPSERDEEHQFGIQIPYKGWLLDVANCQESRQQLPRSLQPRRIQHVLPHRRRWSTGARLGDDPALAASWRTSASST